MIMIKIVIASLLFLHSINIIAAEARFSKQIILPQYGEIPLKGETRIEPTSGTIVTELKYASNRGIGENHEVRWDTSGKNPNRIFFRNEMKFYAIDDVTRNGYEVRLIKDFTKVSPKSDIIYNDVEGDSSNDSDHWAWMAAHYNGSIYEIDAFIHYQISTDTTHTLKPEDLKGTSLNHYSKNNHFSKPNMVEISPLGTGIVLHYGRVWGDEKYGNRPEDLNTWFDGAHLWPLNFDFKKSVPIKISIGQTHSGWAFDKNRNEYFISQNNRTDKIDAVNINEKKSAYDKRMTLASHKDMGWSNGFHFGKMPTSKPGWAFVSTYSSSNDKTHSTDWGADQFIMFEMTDNSWFQKVFRVSPNYNKFDGKYRDEAAAAINLFGNRIYSTSNWGGMLDHREVFIFELDDNWPSLTK